MLKVKRSIVTIIFQGMSLFKYSINESLLLSNSYVMLSDKTLCPLCFYMSSGGLISFSVDWLELKSCSSEFWLVVLENIRFLIFTIDTQPEGYRVYNT